ncbi:hypothetical protein ACLOJK_015060, partial [Asimina triloba]
PDGTQETGLSTSGGINSGSNADERTTATTTNDTEAKPWLSAASSDERPSCPIQATQNDEDDVLNPIPLSSSSINTHIANKSKTHLLQRRLTQQRPHAPRPPARSGRPPPRAAQAGDTNEHLDRTHHAQIMLAAPIFPIFISHRQSSPIQLPSMADNTQDPTAGVFRSTIRLHQQLPAARQPVDGETASDQQAAR